MGRYMDGSIEKGRYGGSPPGLPLAVLYGYWHLEYLHVGEDAFKSV